MLPRFSPPLGPRAAPKHGLNARKPPNSQPEPQVQQQTAGLRGPNSVAWPLIYAVIAGLAVAPAIARSFPFQLPGIVSAASSYAWSVTLFVLFSSGANFVFNLGTALAAAFLGAAVREFSLGFGPALLSYTTRSMQFRLGALPFGGYVRFLDPKTAAARGEKSFEALSPWVRLFAIAAGPVSLL
jgi:Peptidase family M50